MKHLAFSRVLAMLLSLVMVSSMLPTAVFAATSVSYLDQDQVLQTYDGSHTQVTSSTTTWQDGWYVLQEDVTISSRVQVSGNVKLILEDGYTLTCLEGIHVPHSASLTIYAQAGGTGALVAEVSGSAAIGGDDWGDWGDITICGGIITAKSQAQAGIGGGYCSGSYGNVSIYGGVIDTSGIHRGTVHYGSSEMGNILIQGATVTSSGQIGSASGNNPFSGGVSNCGSITIVDSVVTVGTFLGSVPKYWGPGYAQCGDITIADSTVVVQEALGGTGSSLILENESGKNLCVMANSFESTMPERKLGTLISGNTGTVYTDTQIGATVDLSNVNLTVNEGAALTFVEEDVIKSLTVASGAQVTFEKDLTIGQGEISGTISGTSVFSNTGSLTVNQGGDILCDTLSNSGNLTVNQGGEVACKSFSNSGTMTVQGTVTADSTFQNTSYITVLPQGALTTPGGENQGVIENTGTWSNSGSITGDGIVVSTTEIPGAEDQQMSATLPYLNEEGERAWIGQEDVLYPLSSLVKEWKQIDGKTTWYVVTQDTVIDGGVKVTDDVNLLLMDGATLTVHGVNNNGGIRVDSGHTLNIYAQSQGETMGKLVATSGHYNWMAIGGMGCTINIYGGYIDTTDPYGGMGINPGMDNNVGVVNIASGIVHTKSIGGGDTVTEGRVSLVSSGLQNAVVYTNQSRMTEETKNTFRGILFLKDQGQVMGDQDLTMDLTLQAGQTLTVPQGTTLTIPKGITLDVQGDLVVDGTVDVYGTLDNQGNLVNNGQVRIHFDSSFTGTQPTVNGLSYQMDWDTDGDGTVDDTTYVLAGELPTHQDGSKAQTTEHTYTFTGWSPAVTGAKEPTVYTAQFQENARKYTVTLPQNPTGYTVIPQGDTTVDYGQPFRFEVEIAQGYSQTDGFAVKANGVALTAAGDGSYQVNITGETTITVEGVADLTAPTGEIQVAENQWKTFLNHITFGIFCKDKYDVVLSAQDDGSGVEKIQYYLSQTAISETEIASVQDWTDYAPFSIEDEGQYVIYTKITDRAGNVTYLSSNGLVIERVPPVVSGITDGATYYTSQKVTVTDENLLSVTLNGQPEGSTFTLTGNIQATYTIVATDKAGNSVTVTVTMKPIASLADALEGLTIDHVTSADREEIQDYLADLEEMFRDVPLTDDEQASLDALTSQGQALLDRIEEAFQARNTENILQAQDITADCVTLEDRDLLTAAKADLERAMESFSGNYTDEEKPLLAADLQRIQQALDSLDRVDGVQEILDNLPETVEPDDTATEEQILDAKAQYDALTEQEKSLISQQAKAKLESLLADLGDYQVVQGADSQWTCGSEEDLLFVANGPLSKFVGIQVDGEAVDAESYTVVSGSTKITLKGAFLNTLGTGSHTLTVLYTDGQTTAEFEILPQPEVPETGDNSSLALGAALLLASGICALGVYAYRRRKGIIR